jgi:hypothetical protein
MARARVDRADTVRCGRRGLGRLALLAPPLRRPLGNGAERRYPHHDPERLRGGAIVSRCRVAAGYRGLGAGEGFHAGGRFGFVGLADRPLQRATGADPEPRPERSHTRGPVNRVSGPCAGERNVVSASPVCRADFDGLCVRPVSWADCDTAFESSRPVGCVRLLSAGNADGGRCAGARGDAPRASLDRAPAVSGRGAAGSERGAAPERGREVRHSPGLSRVARRRDSGRRVGFREAKFTRPARG